MFKDEQVHAHVFCADCEDRLNRNGETWLLQHCHREDKHTFILKDLLFKSGPALVDEDVTVYAAALIPEIDVAKLVYFAASVFWRASVHDWKAGKEPLNAPKLGEKYSEEFRLFLMGGKFPTKAAIHLSVMADSSMFNMFTLPFGGRYEQCSRLLLYYFGLQFTLWLGNLVPGEVRRTAFFPALINPISVSRVFDKFILTHALVQMDRAKPVGRIVDKGQI
jgi:hypothetical protein